MQIDYPINKLPSWIIDSNQYIQFKELYPDETVFPCLQEHMEPAMSIDIQSYDEIDNIIKSDYIFGYSENTYIQIFNNVYEFYNENPNSAPVRLPDENTTWLGKQIREILEYADGLLIEMCVKKNYLELFNWIVKHKPHFIGYECGTFSLLYYAAKNNNISMLSEGINAGLYFNVSQLLQATFTHKSLECTKIILKHQDIALNQHVLDMIASSGSIEQLKYVIEWSQDKTIRFTANCCISNIENFNYLYENNLLEIGCPKKLLADAIQSGASINIIKNIENLFYVYPSDIRESIDENIIFNYAINKNNIDLYNYLRTCGFKVSCKTFAYVKVHRKSNFSVGLVATHYLEDINK